MALVGAHARAAICPRPMRSSPASTRTCRTAAEAMAPSADKLKAMQWKDAIPLEQKALQALLRARPPSARSRWPLASSGGGGGGGGSAGRDLASLFDLELDTEKNQYETAQTVSPAEQRAKDVEDALAKLDALAKRQEELANQRKSAAELPGALAAGNAAARSRATAAPDGGDGEERAAGPAGIERIERLVVGARELAATAAVVGPERLAERLRFARTAAQGSDQRVQQALRRLQEASDAMKRSGGAQQNPEAARQAAEASARGREPARRYATATCIGQAGFAGTRSGAPERRRACAGGTHRQAGRSTAEQQSDRT